MAKKRTARRTKLTYPEYALRPLDFLHFIYLNGYEDDWTELGLGEDDLEAVEVAIMAGGKDSPIIEGTGGLHKMRFSPLRWNTGKSGALRICFAYFEEYFTTVMVFAYKKAGTCLPPRR